MRAIRGAGEPEPGVLFGEETPDPYAPDPNAEPEPDFAPINDPTGDSYGAESYTSDSYAESTTDADAAARSGS